MSVPEINYVFVSVLAPLENEMVHLKVQTSKHSIEIEVNIFFMSYHSALSIVDWTKKSKWNQMVT